MRSPRREQQRQSKGMFSTREWFLRWFGMLLTCNGDVLTIESVFVRVTFVKGTIPQFHFAEMKTTGTDDNRTSYTIRYVTYIHKVHWLLLRKQKIFSCSTFRLPRGRFHSKRCAIPGIVKHNIIMSEEVELD
jgi:hypothetical protein